VVLGGIWVVVRVKVENPCEHVFEYSKQEGGPGSAENADGSQTFTFNTRIPLDVPHPSPSAGRLPLRPLISTFSAPNLNMNLRETSVISSERELAPLTDRHRDFITSARVPYTSVRRQPNKRTNFAMTVQ